MTDHTPRAAFLNASAVPALLRAPRTRHALAMSSAAPPPPPSGDDSAELPDAAVRAALERALAASKPDSTDAAASECACIWCHGSGKYRCSWCKGEGVKDFLTPEQMVEDVEALKRGEPIPQREPSKMQCSACKGERTLRCMYCKGYGKGVYGFSLAK